MQTFISYSSANRTLVRNLVEVLEGFGNTAWFDQELSGGQAWWTDILRNIRQCELFVFALSPESFDSIACKLEYTYAHDLGKYILPVLISDVNTSLLPPILSEIQFVDYRQPDTKAAIALGRALNMLPPPKPLPDPLPPAPEMPVSPLGKLKDRLDSPSLSYEEQAVILSQLRELLSRGENPQTVRQLLERLRKRTDLFAVIDREIATISVPVQEPPKKQKTPQPSVPARSPDTPKYSDPAASNRLSQVASRLKFVGRITSLPGTLWRYLIVKPLALTGRFLRFLLMRPITLRGMIWRFALAWVLSDLFIGSFIYPYYYNGGPFNGNAVAAATVLGGFIIAIFLAIRLAINRWLPFRTASLSVRTGTFGDDDS